MEPKEITVIGKPVLVQFFLTAALELCPKKTSKFTCVFLFQSTKHRTCQRNGKVVLFI